MYVLAIFVNVINESSCTLLYNFNKFPIFVFHFNISDENSTLQSLVVLA